MRMIDNRGQGALQNVAERLNFLFQFQLTVALRPVGGFGLLLEVPALN